MRAPLETKDRIMTHATSLTNNLKRVISRIIDARMFSERTSQFAFFGVSEEAHAERATAHAAAAMTFIDG
jgi:hypothetical protein